MIIYSNFEGAFARIKDYLEMKEIRFSSLVKSSMSMKKRAEAMEDFRENADVPVFLLVRHPHHIAADLPARSVGAAALQGS